MLCPYEKGILRDIVVASLWQYAINKERFVITEVQMEDRNRNYNRNEALALSGNNNYVVDRSRLYDLL